MTQPSARRARRSSRISWESYSSLAAALALLSFYQFHGINERDSLFVQELCIAVFLFALSIWGALRAFKHHGKWNRRVALVTFAVLLTTLLVATMLSSMIEPPKPQRMEYGEP